MKEAETVAECINSNLTHIFYFDGATNGQTCWVCRLCGFHKYEAEDSQP